MISHLTIINHQHNFDLTPSEINEGMNFYRIFGPTTIHLRQEVYLLISLLLLTVASLQSLYKDSLGLNGDLQLLLLVGLWLSRYPIVRWICSSDMSTSRTPTVSGLLAHWLTSHFMAGQYFDRPNAKIVAKYLGTHHVDDARNGATLSSFFIPSMLYIWHLLNVWIFHPIMNAREFVNKRRSTNKFNNRYHRERRSSNVKINKAYSYWTKFWNIYGPPMQMIIPGATFLFYLWHLGFNGTQEESSHALTMNVRATQTIQEQDESSLLDAAPYGAYRKIEKPTWDQVLMLMSCCGTIMSIMTFGRVILPIGDLIAGGNVLKAVRTDSKNHGSHTGGGKSRSKVQREHMDLSWAEQYRSIVAENRFSLLSKSSSIRFAENLLVCALFPRTSFSCRFTGHCPEGPTLSELSKVLYPVGITSVLRTDGIYQNQFSLMISDWYTAILIALSIVVITFSAIFTQAATLDRSYLSTMGHLVGGWTVLVENNRNLDGIKASPWDPRRRYKKGDLICQTFPGFGTHTIYVATTNQPEGRPFDLSLRATHDLFRNECGHPATSRLIAFFTKIQMMLVMTLMVLIFGCYVLDYYYGSLMWILAANVVAAYGTIRETVNDVSEIQTIAKEISR